MKLINNFKGARSYEESDVNIFFGRKEEINNLIQQVKLNSLTLFFGKSGLGKTSMLKAGLFPEIKKHGFAPIFIRPNYSGNEDFIQYTYAQIIQYVKANFEAGYTLEREKKESESVWEYLHNKPILLNSTPVTPILVFDQFEEIFTLGKDLTTNQSRKNVVNFLIFLSEIVENAIPLSLGEKTKLTEQERNRLFLKYGKSSEFIKVIFSFREEYLSQVYDLSDRMPSLVNSFLHFRLGFLNYDNAYEVIKNAGKPYFEEKAILKILRLLTNSDDDTKAKSKEVESFMLSTYCAYIFETQLKTNESRVNENLLTTDELNTLVEKLFDKGTFILTNNEWKWFRGLVTEKGNRMPLNLTEAYEQALISEPKIESLINARLLRKVDYNGQLCIELIHDRFALVLKRGNEEFKRRRQRQTYSALAILTLVVFIVIIGILNKFNNYKREVLTAKLRTDSLQLKRLEEESNYRMKEDSLRSIYVRDVKKANDSIENFKRTTSRTIKQYDLNYFNLKQELNNAGSELEKLEIEVQIRQNQINKQLEELTIKQNTISYLEREFGTEKSEFAESKRKSDEEIRTLQDKLNRAEHNLGELERSSIVGKHLVANYFNYTKFDTLYDNSEYKKLFDILGLDKNKYSQLSGTLVNVIQKSQSGSVEAIKSKLNSTGLRLDQITNLKEGSSALPSNSILYFSDSDYIKAFLIKEQLLPTKLKILDGRILNSRVSLRDITIVL